MLARPIELGLYETYISKAQNMQTQNFKQSHTKSLKVVQMINITQMTNPTARCLSAAEKNMFDFGSMEVDPFRLLRGRLRSLAPP